MSRCAAAVALLLLTLPFARPAGAVLMGYDDRSAWDAAVFGDVFLVDFNSIVADAAFSSGPVDVGPFTIAQAGGNPPLASVNLIDAAAFGFSGAESVNGSTYVLGFVAEASAFPSTATSTYITMLFDAPVAAWGADFKNPNNSVGIDLFLIPVGAVSVNEWVPFDASGAGDGFFGFVQDSGQLYAGVAIWAGTPATNGAGERFGMDNVSGATIPEPTTAALFALGLTGLAVAGRRRR